MAREDPQLKLRLPENLKTRIAEIARAKGRSVNAEIVARLSDNDGRTLRDWFAGQALTGLMSDAGLRPASTSEFEHMARRLFQVADAMLAERDKIASPAGEIIRSAQDEVMEASPMTAQPAVGEASPSIAERVWKIVVDYLGVDVEKVTEDASFIDDLGADSLDLVELVMSFEEEFDIQIEDFDAERCLTVMDAIRYVEKAKGGDRG